MAISTIKGKQSREKIGNQEFPKILRSTPSIYVTKDSGEFGQGDISIRGLNEKISH
ncbi:MAG: hypothetical protein ACMUEM_07710 [Flavobacteriales bacterium AspAUS03]